MLFWPRARAFARGSWSCSEVKKSGLAHVSAPLVRLLRISAHVLSVSCARAAFVFGRSILPDTDIGTAIVRECVVIGPSMNRQCATLARDFSMRQRISACAVLLLFGYLASSVAQGKEYDSVRWGRSLFWEVHTQEHWLRWVVSA